jgi:DNA-binding NarL/FixJ family response regulator
MAKAKTSELIQFIAERNMDLAIEVWKEFQREQPYIPRFPRTEDPTQAFILQGLKEGKSIRRIAKDLDIGVRAVQLRLNKPVKPKQIDLF